MGALLAIPSLLAFASEKAAASGSEHTVTIFIIEIVLLLFVGRLLGELMQRLGQPAVMGQIIAGVILGPSVFGHLLPGAYETIFPDDPVQKRMIDAISQLGIIMLLLLTGMETDLKLVNKMRRTAFFTSISGIVIPFACGYALGEFLPDSLLPDPAKRLVTSLFLATALSISSVKIVAMVIMEVGFLRRNVGQIILASAILDDTIGWIIIAIIAGIAAGGGLSIATAGVAFVGTVVFLAFSFTVGRRLVAFAIRWTNDNMVMEMPVITAILVITLVAGLITHAIGVHTVLGAFVVGILVGQSPILTKHIEEQLRGLIVALFAPVFFAVAGREIDLTLLNSVTQLELAAAFILIASVGKILGAFVGGKLGSMTTRESTALAIGMNARGSTEVIVATIGLSLGVLNRDLFTLIVVMAVVTTLITPPLLRWALKRIPPSGEEKERLEREETEAKEFVPNIERILVAADDGPNGVLASRLAGLFAGAQQKMSTVLEYGSPANSIASNTPGEVAQRSAEAAVQVSGDGDGRTETPPLIVTGEKDRDFADAVLKEADKGYDMLFLGTEGRAFEVRGRGSGDFDPIAVILEEFDGVTAIALRRGISVEDDKPDKPLNILLPTIGTDYSQIAAEVAISLAKASGGTVTALHVAPPATETDVLRHRSELLDTGRSLVQGIKELGDRHGVKVRPQVRSRPSPEQEMMRRALSGGHDLMVLGVKSRGTATGSPFFGRRIAALLEGSPCSILLVSS